MSTSTTAARPTDSIGIACQEIVDRALGALQATGRAGATVTGVCRDRALDPMLTDHAGYSIGSTFVIRYPPDATEARWPQLWYDVTVHEIGHTWQRTLPFPKLHEYAAIRGMASFSAEDYADVFAAVIGHASGLAYIGSPPPPAQVEALCAAALLPC